MHVFQFIMVFLGQTMGIIPITDSLKDIDHIFDLLVIGMGDRTMGLDVIDHTFINEYHVVQEWCQCT